MEKLLILKVVKDLGERMNQNAFHYIDNFETSNYTIILIIKVLL